MPPPSEPPQMADAHQVASAPTASETPLPAVVSAAELTVKICRLPRRQLMEQESLKVPKEEKELPPAVARDSAAAAEPAASSAAAAQPKPEPEIQLPAAPMTRAAAYAATLPVASAGVEVVGRPSPVARHVYLVARHYIPAMVELTWEPLPRRSGGRPPNTHGVAASNSVVPSEESVAARKQPAGGFSGVAARGAACEVRQEEAGLRGAYFGAFVLSDARADGLVHVQYAMVYESVHKDALLSEWLQPCDADALRPKPPPPPDGFHATLKMGDAVDVWFESGWWPALVVANRGAHACEVGSHRFMALRRTVPMTRVRPRWRWLANAWHSSKEADDATVKA